MYTIIRSHMIKRVCSNVYTSYLLPANRRGGLSASVSTSNFNYDGTSYPHNIRRDLSTSTSDNDGEDHERKWNDERTWKLLYHRSPSRSTTPRALFGVSTFNICYWLWYVADFTPAINSSALAKHANGQIDQATLELLLVDETIGFVGLGVSGIIWLGAFLYSKQLVSAIWGSVNAGGGEEEDEKSLIAISTLKLPFLTQPKILDKLDYNPETTDFDSAEDVMFTESELKTESSVVGVFAPGELTLSEDQRKNDVLVKFEGDFSRLRGHIALKDDDAADYSFNNGEIKMRPWLASLYSQKYLLDIASADEVMPNASPTLLNSLVLRDYHFPKASKKGGRYDSNNGDSAVKNRRAARKAPTKTPRRVSQLEMARGTLKQSIKSKGESGRKKRS